MYINIQSINQSIKANQIKANQIKTNQINQYIYIWTHLPINLRIHRKEKLCRETKISVYARNSSITNETFHFLENEWYSNMYTIYIHKCMHAYITLHYITYTTLVNIIWICIYIYVYLHIIVKKVCMSQTCMHWTMQYVKIHFMHNAQRHKDNGK